MMYVGLEQQRHIRQLGLQLKDEIGHAELKEAFRRSALTWHPDRHESDAKLHAEAQFKQCQISYHALKLYLASKR